MYMQHAKPHFFPRNACKIYIFLITILPSIYTPKTQLKNPSKVMQHRQQNSTQKKCLSIQHSTPNDKLIFNPLSILFFFQILPTLTSICLIERGLDKLPLSSS